MSSFCGIIRASATVVLAFVSTPAPAADDVICKATRVLVLCDPTNPETIKSVCACDLAKLKPLQSAVGMTEVMSKKADIEGKPQKECDKLSTDPIKVVSGPGGDLFITDHHHTAYAWLLVEQDRHESPANGICQVVNLEKGLPLTFPSDDQFWAALEGKHLLRRPPQSLVELADDPYRSLASLVEHRGGFCKTNLEFAEFAWADFFRERLGRGVENPTTDQLSSNVSAALNQAHSAEAAERHLPGYCSSACEADGCPK